MDKPWFDAQTGTLLLDDYVAETDSYRRIIADDVITDDEIAEHGQRVVSLLHQLEESLTPEIKAVATEALCQLAVLHALQLKRLETAPPALRNIGL
jgi:hypothetical protein